MKREIKFRAWDKKILRMFGSFNNNYIAVGEKFCGMQKEDSVHYFQSWHDKDLIPMQYTGLKDKNGKEIYEGDVVKRRNDEILICKWYNNLGCYAFENKNFRYLTSSMFTDRGYAGLTLLKINFKNVANTFISFFTNTNTAARTYTLQDRDGILVTIEVIGNIYENPELLEVSK